MEPTTAGADVCEDAIKLPAVAGVDIRKAVLDVSACL